MPAQDINVVALVKGSERYVFLYDDDSRAEALRMLGRYASNPDLSFTWYDAAVLSQKVRQNAPRSVRTRFVPQPTMPRDASDTTAANLDPYEVTFLRFLEYLISQRGISFTLKSYREDFLQLVDFQIGRLHITRGCFEHAAAKICSGSP